MKAGFIDGDTVDSRALTSWPSCPHKEVLVAQVLGGLNAPFRALPMCAAALSAAWSSPSTPLPRSRAPSAQGDFPISFLCLSLNFMGYFIMSEKGHQPD